MDRGRPRGWGVRITIGLAGYLAFGISVNAQTGFPWRFWDSGDGFIESYSSSAALNPDGTVWVKHGLFGPIELLNGYTALHLKEPGGSGRLETAPDGTLWTWTDGKLKRCSAGVWSTWGVPEIARLGRLRGNAIEATDISYFHSNLRGTIQVAAIDRRRALILLPDRVLEFNTDRAETRLILSTSATRLTRFISILKTTENGILLTGSGGIGKLDLREPDQWEWRVVPAPSDGSSEFESPTEGAAGVLCLTGLTASRIATVSCLRGSGWQTEYRAVGESVEAWAGEGNSVWVRDGNHVIQITGNRRIEAPRDQSLSGILLRISPETHGRFWLATSQGLARYTPLMWRQPEGSPALDDVVNAITEDSSGTVWFLAAHELLSYDGRRWMEYPLPAGETPWAIFTEGFGVTATGELAIRTSGDHLLMFDLRSHRFRKLQHPGGHTVRMLLSASEGHFFTEVDPDPNTGSRLEAFDGQHFTEMAGRDVLGGQSDLRSLAFGPNGEIWAGSTTDFGVWRDGKFERIDSRSGYDERGAYAIFRDKSGTILAGGRDSLYSFINGRWQKIHSGLDRVRNMLRSRDGTLWVASGTGVHRYRNGNWIPNSAEEGLPSSVVYKLFEDSKGRIWAGTTRGLSLFHPDADLDPPLATLSEDENPDKSPPDAVVHLTFSGIDKWKFTPSDRLLFSWRIDHGPWSPFQPVSSASFSKLTSGAHSFEVRAMDRNGNVSLKPAAHQFTVMLPWYQMPAFLLLATTALTVIASLLTVAGINYRHRGRLIVTLNRKNRLESARQKILEMIAERQPLEAIFGMIADLVAAHIPSSACVVLFQNESELNVYCDARMPADLAEGVYSFASHEPSFGEWRSGLKLLAARHKAGNCTFAPFPWTAGNVRGLAVLLCRESTEALSDASPVLTAFAALGAGAAESAGLYRQLGYQARHDVLTDLPNRLFFEENLEAMVFENKPFALLYIDLDRFKQINDTMGHRAGDLFLQQVALLIRSGIRNNCTLFRVGGDEFTVLAPEPGDRSSLQQMAQEILSALRRPIRVESQDFFASASIGASIFPADGDTSSTLQKHADIAMYRAKSLGSNRFEFYSAGMAASAQAAFSIERAIRKSLDHNLFQLHYQPQFTFGGEVAGFESLIRFSRDEDRHIGPGSFIPIAESCGLIGQIGRWVLEEACRQLREWNATGFHVSRLAVNVSATEVSRASFPDDLARIIAVSGVNPSLLELELTESAVLQNAAESARQMERLKAIGVRIAIDDFGTGYSSLSYLQNLPIDTIKIDRSFVSTIVSPDQKAPIIQTIVALGRNLGLDIVAEGVETRAQLSVLLSAGMSSGDLVQGYLLSKPVSAAEAQSLLDPNGIKSLARLNRALEHPLLTRAVL